MDTTRIDLPSCSFHLRQTRGKDKTIDGAIYIRYFVCGKYVERSTNIHIPVTQWDKKHQLVTSLNKNSKRLNAELVAIKEKFDKQIMSVSEHITPLIVQQILSGEYTSKEDLPQKTDFIKYSLDYNQQRYNMGKIAYSTYDNGRLYILAFQKFIKSKTGNDAFPICNLSLDIINKYIEWRMVDRKNTKEGINKTLTPLFKAIKYAGDNELISLQLANTICNNYLNIKEREYKSDTTEKKVRYLTPDQMNRFNGIYSKVKHDRTREIMDMFLFAFHCCGLRISDIITLEWKHINFDKRVLSKNFFKTKTNSIDLPLTAPAISILERWKGRNKRFVFDILPENFNLNDAKKLNTLRLSKNRTIQQSLKSVGDKIGLKFNLTFHCARHTFAVLAIKKGIDIFLVSKLLGHKSIYVTEKVYADYLPKDVDQIVKEKLTFDFSDKTGAKDPETTP